jgi:hypothetical protein
MYDALGLHWAAALPGFIALAMIPFTVMFYKYGAQIRAKCKYAADAERQMNALMAARMAAMKQEQDDIAGEEQALESEGKAPAAGMAGNEVGQPEAQPAEQIGGEGNVGDVAVDEKEPTAEHAEAHAKRQHEWTIYEELADRDEVDLSDDERLRLQSLHETFDYAKAKKA